MASFNTTLCCWSCFNINPRCEHCRRPVEDISLLRTPVNIRPAFQIPVIAAFNLKAIHNYHGLSREGINNDLIMLRNRWPYLRDRMDGAEQWCNKASNLLVQHQSTNRNTLAIVLEDADGNVPTMDAMTWNEYGGAMDQGMLVCLSLKSAKVKHMDNCACRKCLRALRANEAFRKGMGMMSKEEIMRESHTAQEWAFMLDGQLKAVMKHVPTDKARIQEYIWW